MNTTFIHRIIRRSNLNQLLLAVVGLAIIIVLMGLAKNVYYNLIAGPFPISAQQVASMTSVDHLQQYYVTVTGEEALDTGFQYVRKSYGIETGHDSLIALVVDDSLLLVQHPGDVSEKTTYSGALEPIPSDMQREVLNALILEFPDLRDAFLPFMLDAGDFRLNNFLGLAAAIIGLLVCLWLLIRAVTRMGDIEKHPISRTLRRFGDPEQTAEMIDSEMQQNHATLNKRTHLTRNWLVYTTSSSLGVARFDDITWLYKMVTQHRTNGIPTGKTYTAMVWDKYGSNITIPGKEKQINELLEAVAQRAPWAIGGHTKEIEHAWKHERDRVVAAVEQRKRQVKESR